MIRRGLSIAGLLALAGAEAAAIQACTAKDRETAARTALDAVDQADRTCADLREALHRDAGAEGGP